MDGLLLTSLVPIWVVAILFTLFLFVNFCIVISDLTRKKIPNRLLLLLIFILFLYGIFQFSTGKMPHIDWGIGVIMTFFIGFGIYMFRGWAPGDAKYFIVLSLFLYSSIDMIRFIGNISTLSVAGILGVSLYSIIKGGTGRNNILSRKILKSEGNKKNSTSPIVDIIFFIIPLLGFFLGIIFFREFLYGNNPTFYSLGVDAAVVLFIGVLLIRVIQGEIMKRYKKSKKVIYSFFIISALPLLYGIIDKGYALWYYLRDIILFGIPTIILIYWVVRYSVYIISMQERSFKKYSEMLTTEIPQYVVIGDKLIKVENRGDVEKIYKEYGEKATNMLVIFEKGSPFGHYIFVSFIITAFTPLHLAHIILSHWYYFLSSIWEFFRQWI